jgi:Flp pilus assembly pilin Flp
LWADLSKGIVQVEGLHLISGIIAPRSTTLERRVKDVNRTRSLRPKLKRLRKRGQGLVEYALVLAMIVIVVIIMLKFLGDIVFVNYYSKIGSSMDAVNR